MHQEVTEAQPSHTLNCFLIQSEAADMVFLLKAASYLMIGYLAGHTL